MPGVCGQCRRLPARANEGTVGMEWARCIGHIAGTMDRHLVDRNRYLLAENRILRKRVRKIQFTRGERIALAKAAKPLGRAALAEIATLVTPDTLLRWHRRLVEKIGVKEEDAGRSNVGRPATDQEIVELVLLTARENPSWGYDRIVGALAELGRHISATTVGEILREHGLPPAPERKKGKSWEQFVREHKEVLCACDFFTKEVWTLLGPVTYYVLFFIHIASRKVCIAGCTIHPNEAWMKQIARNLTMEGGFLSAMKYLILDRDAKFAESFREVLKSAGVEPLRLPARSPNLNAFAERFVRSIKEECLDQLILFGEPSLQRAISQYIEHYHHERPHQGKDNLIPLPLSIPLDQTVPRAGPVQCHQRLGGLLKSYYRKAA